MSNFNKKYIKDTIFFLIIILLAVFVTFKFFDLDLTKQDLQKSFFLPLIYRIIKYPFDKKKQS